LSVEFAALRQTMVDSQVRTQDVTDAALIEAMRGVPREGFAPGGRTWMAYADAEVEYVPGRWMLRPRDVAKLLQALRPHAGERAAAMFAPYAAAILERMGLSVTRFDTPDAAPEAEAFDIVVCEGAVARAPEAWKAALASGGRLGLIERDGPVGRARLYVRSGAVVSGRDLFDSTPPMLAGFEAERGFVL
jgi:protein-L-isoaspartate(D-aspartate) O-methyltransferase